MVGGRWLSVGNGWSPMREITLPQAAAVLGLTREGGRRRLLKGRLEGRKSNETGEWVVLLPDELAAPTLANGGQASASVAERCQHRQRGVMGGGEAGRGVLPLFASVCSERWSRHKPTNP